MTTECHTRRVRRGIALALSSALFAWTMLAGCGDGDKSMNPGTGTGTGTGTGGPYVIAVAAGDGQTARIASALPIPPAVIVRDVGNNPAAGVAVTFTVESGGGSLTQSSAQTDASGMASVGWTLGPAAGENGMLATVALQSGAAAHFDATARLPYWTYMVYMAADNNLTIAGVNDIDEIEAAGFDPEVQVAIQAEFSPAQLQLAGCTNPACINRPNFNTFRYVPTGAGDEVPGPNGAAEDVGDRNMVDPDELREFVAWAKDSYPAERYALVLWNHGGGYTGLLQDESTGGSDLMALDDLPDALGTVAPIDVIDFDMCLMGGYETVAKIAGLAEYVAFSEEVVPGEGNPYTSILDGLQANATATTRTISQIFVDRFHESYMGNRASTTRSAYEVAGIAAFEPALDALAGTLSANLGPLASAIGTAAAGSQKYEFRQLTDCVDFLSRLRDEVSDPTLIGQIDAVLDASTGTFRVGNRARTGEGAGVEGGGASDVSRSNGLSILMPSGGTDDRLPDSGPGSFAAYQASFPGAAWTTFLSAWLSGGATDAHTDQGAEQLETYLVWHPDAIAQDVDVDFWILEPNGNLFIPYLGSVTPNGTLTNDSYQDATSYEGYFTNRFIENGLYSFYANLYADPQNYQPYFDFLYRFGQTTELTSLYIDDPKLPYLSFDVSWLADPTPTFEEANGLVYTDLQLIATIGFPALATGAREGTGKLAQAPMAGARDARREITAAQWAAARAGLEARHRSAGTPKRATGSAAKRPVPDGLHGAIVKLGGAR